MEKQTAFSLFIRQALLYPLVSPFLPQPADVRKDLSYANGQKVGTLEVVEQKNYPADQALVDNGDGTISDLSTGLMWAQDGNGAGCNNGATLNMIDTLVWAAGLDFAGHQDWRVPTMNELGTILVYNRVNPAIDITKFTNTANAYYWSSSTYAPVPTNYYCGQFSNASATFLGRLSLNRVRAVRTI